MNSKPLIVGLAGPTGIGKTDIAVRLAKKINGELVSCDSVQIFKHLDIGSNKFKPSLLDPPQHLVDVLEPTHEFSVGDYYRLCLDCISNVISRDKVPIIVGGTGFYFDWLLNGQSTAPLISDEKIAEVRRCVDSDCKWEDSLARLEAVDPKYARSLLPNDNYRLVRALAFFEEYGYPLSDCQRKPNCLFGNTEWRCVFLTRDRMSTYREIDRRCEQMVKTGIIDETSKLLKEGLLKKDSIAGRSIGYKETIDFLDTVTKEVDKRRTFFAFLDAFTAATRQYARKQETWFANKFGNEFVWMERGNCIDETVEDIYKFCVANNIDQWQQASSRLKEKIRSIDEMEKRRKSMRTYSPDYVIFNDTKEVEGILACLNK